MFGGRGGYNRCPGLSSDLHYPKVDDKKLEETRGREKTMLSENRKRG
jgi:hypothetical protein